VVAAELAREIDAAEHARGFLVALLAGFARGKVAGGARDERLAGFGADVAGYRHFVLSDCNNISQ
jgi:hypothetical protein